MIECSPISGKALKQAQLLTAQEGNVIIEKLELGPFGSNCFIIGDESSKEGMVIDPGAEADRVLSRVKDLGLEIKLIVLTHGHMDHVGAVREVKEATGADIAIHTEDAESLQATNPMGMMLRLSLQAPPPPDRLLTDGDSIDIGDRHFLVIHTPGHTLGGICLLGEGVAFTGDTLFNLSIGRSDMPGGDGRQLVEGIVTKLMILPDDTIVYPGHGPDTTIGLERKWNPFLNI